MSIRLLPGLSIQEMVVTVVWLAGSQLRIEPSSDVAANMYALFSKWGQDGWILALLLLFFFFAFLWTETKSRSTKTQKRERRISSRLGRISFVNKGFIKWPKREFFHAGSSREIPSLPSGCQSERRIRFILPAWGFCDIISGIKKRVSLGWTSDDSLYVQLEDLFIWPQIHEFYFLQTNDRKLDVVKSN